MNAFRFKPSPSFFRHDFIPSLLPWLFPLFVGTILFFVASEAGAQDDQAQPSSVLPTSGDSRMKDAENTEPQADQSSKTSEERRNEPGFTLFADILGRYNPNGVVLYAGGAYRFLKHWND